MAAARPSEGASRGRLLGDDHSAAPPAGVVGVRRQRGDLRHDRSQRVIAATARHQPPGRVLILTVATLAIFWLAHVYAGALSHQMRSTRTASCLS